jgi:hypothetical protein
LFLDEEKRFNAEFAETQRTLRRIRAERPASEGGPYKARETQEHRLKPVLPGERR